MLLINLLSLLPFVLCVESLLKVPLKSTLSPKKPLGLGNSLFKKPNPTTPVRNDALKVVTTVQAGAHQIFDNVLIDTGSAILWVGGEEAYRPGRHSQDINATFSVGYGAGGVSGNAFKDTVVIGEAQANGQIIGSANFTTGFELVTPFDGILGLGPSGSNGNEVSGFDTTPTFVETLAAQKTIQKPVFGIFISPLGQDGELEGQGEITFGGVDETKIKGDVVWLPQNPPVNFHWEFNMSSFKFGPIILNNLTTARTDTGFIGIALPFDQFFDILHTFNASLIFDGQLEGYLAFASNTTSSLPPLDFDLGEIAFSILPEQYIIPQNLYSSLNLTADPTLAYTWIANAGPGAFDLGQKWLESVYTAYDMENHRLGFATVA